MTDQVHLKEVLSIKQLEKSYPGVRALKGVDISFNSHEVHGLIGENGAGKSTLIKILAGIVKPDAGTIHIRGNLETIGSSKHAAKLGLCFIHQELHLVTYFNAMENIFLGHSYPKRYGVFANWKELRKQTLDILDTLQADFPIDIPVRYLSAVQRAMVAIARAFARSGSMYFMDEPATALTDIEKEKLFTVVRNLKAQGKTVVYVSHNLDDILRITDRITIMRDGQVVHRAPTSTMNKDSIITHMIGKSLESAFPPKLGTIGKPLLQVRDITNSSLSHISFTLRAGEILGIGGLVGSGRSELLETIFGVRPLSSGTMMVSNTRYKPSSPKEAIDSHVVLVPEERRKGGLVLNRSIYENITMMSLQEISKMGFLNHKNIRSSSLKAGAKVRLKSADYSHHVSTLSGGNQQKVVFAKSVFKAPKILMLDEPSKGVDVGARYEIYTIIRELASLGTAIILVSSDFNEVLGLADRILFIKEGTMVGIHENNGIDEKDYLNYCYGRNLS